MAAQLQISPLYRSRNVSISDVRCRPHSCECGGEEWCEADEIVFVRAGVFVRRQGRRELVADANQVLFFNRQESYQVRHPAEGGDDCTVFRFGREVLREATGEFSGGRIFEFEQALGGQRSFLLYQRLRRFLLAGGKGKLAVEEAAMNLLGDVIGGIYRARGIEPKRSCRAGTREAHSRHAEMTRLLLATRFAEDLTLEDIARLVHCSAFHLARIFRRETGVSIHQYRHRLRLHTALDRIHAGASDLTGLALDVGFSSHSHFTDAFYRTFGLSPSACRKQPRNLREMSRNLKVDD